MLSHILSSLPEETVEKTGDYKRVFVKGIITSWATYLIPKEWVADKSLALPQHNNRPGYWIIP